MTYYLYLVKVKYRSGKTIATFPVMATDIRKALLKAKEIYKTKFPKRNLEKCVFIVMDDVEKCE